MSRLTIDITPEQHRHLKAMAALEGKTIKDYALERLLPTADENEKDWERFKDFINARIASAEAGNISPRNFDEIVDTAFSRKTAA